MNLNRDSSGTIQKKVFITALFAGLWIFSSTLAFAQRDFNMSEKKLLEKFKMANSQFLEGESAFKKGNYKKATKKLNECLSIMPEHANAYFYHAQISLKEKDFTNALKWIEKAKDNFKFIAQFQNFTHQQLMEMMRDQRSGLQEQLQSMENTLNQTSTSSSNRDQISSQISLIKQKISTLDQQMNRPITNYDEMPADYFFIHGNIFFQMKQFGQARDQYIQAIATDPTNVGACNNLTNIYFVIEKNNAKAWETIQQAETHGVQINPKLKEAVQKAVGK